MEQHERRPEEEGFTGERIPGERDAGTLTHRQPGSMGGRFSGDDAKSSIPEDVMDAATIGDRKREGGG